ncbi:hypothetical protein GP486_007336, partial [Trichoglossum hirsutum]
MDGLRGPLAYITSFSRRITEIDGSRETLLQQRLAKAAQSNIDLAGSTRTALSPQRRSVRDPTDFRNWHSRQGFSRPGNKGTNNQKSGGTPSPSATPYQSSSTLAPRVPPLPNSPSFASSLTGTTAMDEGADDKQFIKVKDPLWYNEKWTRQVVKGNFMTIVARPKIVEDGEWLAHQVSEMYRMLSTITKILVDPEDPSCNVCVPQTCPTMSAGTHTYTWLDSNRQPTKLPAPQYINLVQKWVVNKLSDTKAFPTDQSTAFSAASYPSGGLDTPGANTPIPAGPTTLNASLQTLSGRNWVGKISGFPETHLQDCKNLVRQMFRVYAHIYWHHFVDLYHLKMETSLNSVFTNFIFFVRVCRQPLTEAI